MRGDGGFGHAAPARRRSVERHGLSWGESACVSTPGHPKHRRFILKRVVDMKHLIPAALTALILVPSTAPAAVEVRYTWSSCVTLARVVSFAAYHKAVESGLLDTLKATLSKWPNEKDENIEYAVSSTFDYFNPNLETPDEFAAGYLKVCTDYSR